MRARAWSRLAVLFSALALLPLVATAASDKPVELPQPLTRDAIRELVARLNDEEVRKLLLAQLDKAAAPAAASPHPTSMAAGLAGDVDRTRTELGAMLRAVPTLPSEFGAAVGRFSEGRPSYHLLVVVLGFAVMLVVGFVAERVARRLFANIGGRLERTRDHAHEAEGGHVVARVIVEFLLLGVFAVSAFAVFLAVYQGHEASRELIVAALLATLQARVAILIARLLLAPQAPAERALPYDDASARTLYRGIVSLACLFVVLDVTQSFLLRWDVPRESFLVVVTLGRVLFVVLFLRLVWRLARPIGALIRGDGESGLRRMLADLWPVLMTAYVLILVVALTMEDLSGRARVGRAGLLSLLVVIVLPLVDMALCRLLARRASAVSSSDRPGVQASFVPVIRKGVHILVTVAGVLVIVYLWNLDLMGMASEGLGARVTGVIVNIGLTIMLAYLVWQLARTAIDRRLEREAGPRAVSDPGEIGGTGASRLKTLLPLARGTIFAVLCVMSVLTILAAFGVNIGPLLAGAGVVGLAVGFGAQTLVRDIISGAFYLMDDAFRVGEYIDVGDAKGTVERIGIRSMQLRHHRGPINVVPYGSIRRMTNQSRDWVIEKLEFHLTYDTDIAKVKKIIKRIGQELATDPALGPQIIEPLKSQGVLAMEDSGMLVKAKFTAKPGEQFVIRREAYQRIKKAFDDAGIHFAHRQVTVFVPPGPGAAAASAVAAGGAAAAALPERPSEEAP
ncbi:MAG TPA: mechanosensitive ion channel domain-containing protein [Methylomirabilota bacterium]|jgi:small-conductance mechanosensitive channel